MVFVPFFFAARSTGALASWRRLMAAVELPNSDMDELPEDEDEAGIVVLPEAGIVEQLVTVVVGAVAVEETNVIDGEAVSVMTIVLGSPVVIVKIVASTSVVVCVIVVCTVCGGGVTVVALPQVGVFLGNFLWQ